MESEMQGAFLVSTVLVTILAGGFVMLLMYVVRLARADTKRNERGLASRKAADQQLQQQQERQQQKKEQAQAKGKKKAADSRWTGRTDKQAYAHPWLLTTLKGHSGQVLDMDFSSNGKYLASCAEEEPDPGGDPSSCSSSDCNKENSQPSSATPSPRTKGLSRRQRKNRRRDDSSPPENKKKPKPRKPEQYPSAGGTNGSGGNSKKPIPYTPLKQFLKLDISERDFANFLRAYLLSPEQMLTLGYPVESTLHPGRAIIFKSPISVPSYTTSDYRHPKFDVNKSRFDVNAREFVPGRGMDYAQIKAEWKANHDSGQGSGSSSDSGENLDDAEDSSDISNSSSDSGSFSLSSSPASRGDELAKNCKGDRGSVVGANNSDDTKVVCVSSAAEGSSTNSAHEERKCVRCGRGFLVGSDNEYLTQEKCLYHWGKLRNVAHPGKHARGEDSTEYACCRGKSDSRGCTTGKLHVWNGLAVGFNGPFDLYVRTRPRKTLPPDGNYGVYALDCEMCYTAQGLELTKITVIGADGRLVYDCFVRPECEIVDYNTRFSGITAKDLSKKGATKTLREVQNDLMGFVNADTILIGHGLENDLRALRIMHSTVIDTAVAFPHYNGLPYRRSLKSLTSSFLKRDIQQGAHGHNSNEDARACMELMLWRVRKDFCSILDHYHRPQQH